MQRLPNLSAGMWPWEHALFAYVFFSVYVHLRYRSPPGDWPVVVLVGASLLPDVVDKPLAWQFGLFETGWGIAHSLFVAVPVTLIVYVIASRRGARLTGVAFGAGYLLHLVGDVVPASLGRGRFYPDPVMWPLGNPTTIHDHSSLRDGLHALLTELAMQLHAMDVTPTAALQLGSIVVGGLLWLADGRPGLRLLTGRGRPGAGESRAK